MRPYEVMLIFDASLEEETIRAELGKAFEILSLEEFRFDQDEPDGHRHLGWSCVLRKRQNKTI